MDFLLRLFDMADVTSHGNVVGDMPAVIIDRGDGHGRRIDGAVFTAGPHLPRPFARIEQFGPHGLVECCVVSTRLEDARILSGQLVHAVAGHVLEGLIHAQYVSVLIGDEDGVLAFESGGGNAQLFFHLLALGDIPGITAVVFDIFEAHVIHGDFYRIDLAVLGAMP